MAPSCAALALNVRHPCAGGTGAEDLVSLGEAAGLNHVALQASMEQAGELEAGMAAQAHFVRCAQG